YGGVFRLQAGATSATLTPLHSFQKSDGDNTLTLASPFVDANGNVFGVTYAGGPSGHGVVFELTPPPSGQSGWTYTILHAFT
ncbi:choice-of-anchor tandem repeat GloVer-containing protein, partial [Acinetobacter baumannii]